ncbi:MAG: hypothetical protein ACTS6H_00795 [Candidatus Hodgkinia cicadicola]
MFSRPKGDNFRLTFGRWWLQWIAKQRSNYFRGRNTSTEVDNSRWRGKV